MANKLRVDELRAELSKRGLDTTGTKLSLVRRLQSASENEDKESMEAHDAGGNKKRGRENEDIDSNEAEKIKAVDKYRQMNIKQLREQAKLQGVSTAGTKELLERLCNELPDNNDSSHTLQVKEEEGVITATKKAAAVLDQYLPDYDAVKKETDVRRLEPASENDDKESNGAEKIKAVEKYHEMNIKQLREQAKLQGVSTAGTKKELLVRLCNELPDNDNSGHTLQVKEEEKVITATKKGAAVLDQYLPEEIKSQYHVLKLGNDVYDAMLNQTDIGNNNNKFYVIQLLESDDGGRFIVYNRWGRVGVKGQDKLFGPYTSQDTATYEFEEKFYAKTKNSWSNRKEFKCYPKCYTWLEMDYDEVKKETDVKEKSDSGFAIQPRETKLEPRVAEFISLICNVSMMKQQMMEIGYNANKLPLGKLSKSTILKGYGVLKRIADVIGTANKQQLDELTGEFYTVIPHDFGFKKMREFVIDTPQKLKHKLEMVEALGEIEVATKLLEDEQGIQEDPLYCHYSRLHCELTPLEVDSEEFSMVGMYMRNTHAKTHSQYTVDIVQIFKVSRKDEGERFTKFSTMKNRMLLWHGSRLSNWAGILSQGLRIAPPEAPVTGYMFGKGVYFADMFSKSANYCYASSATSAGVLLLCEVALGNMAELLNANYDADMLPEGMLSTKGVGATAPDPSGAKILGDGVVVPLGKPKAQKCPKGSLLYNEFIVYNVDQIRMRYVVQVNFKYNK